MKLIFQTLLNHTVNLDDGKFPGRFIIIIIINILLVLIYPKNVKSYPTGLYMFIVCLLGFINP